MVVCGLDGALMRLEVYGLECVIHKKGVGKVFLSD